MAMNSNELIRDPVCGMPVLPAKSLPAIHGGVGFYLCSELCRKEFLSAPDKYAFKVLEQVAKDGDRRIAYFSMEVAVQPGIPTYSGGLGVLAGDTLRSCADLRIPAVGVSLLYSRGYLDQRLDERGNQRELPVAWDPHSLLQPLPLTVSVSIEGRTVWVAAWRYNITGEGGHTVPVVFLDTNIEKNRPSDREITCYLYGGDEYYRIAQEIVLGIGGLRILRALGYNRLHRFHLNEGHASLLTLELLNEHDGSAPVEWDFERVREACVFTTHTPVPAGHDRFDYGLIKRVLGEFIPIEILRMLGGNDELNLTVLAMNLSRYVNGVAKRHREVSEAMFPGYPIDSVTNGVHSATWTCGSFRSLFDKYIPGWRSDPTMLRHAIAIPKNEIWEAHMAAKDLLVAEVSRRGHTWLSRDALTIGFARRATQYKRADLIFFDVRRLTEIARTVGPLQFVFAGKAHPKDEPGKELIRRVVQLAGQLKGEVPVVYLENYDMELGKLLTAGVDLWLNTPLPPLEASGTSGMKAAHNGVPSLSVMDGWWVEGHVENVTGWSIDDHASEPSAYEEINRQHAQNLYRKLSEIIAPMFFHDREKWLDVMRHSIALNASFFNTHRMVQQYAASAYL